MIAASQWEGGHSTVRTAVRRGARQMRLSVGGRRATRRPHPARLRPNVRLRAARPGRARRFGCNGSSSEALPRDVAVAGPRAELRAAAGASEVMQVTNRTSGSTVSLSCWTTVQGARRRSPTASPVGDGALAAGTKCDLPNRDRTRVGFVVRGPGDDRPVRLRDASGVLRPARSSGRLTDVL